MYLYVIFYVIDYVMKGRFSMKKRFLAVFVSFLMTAVSLTACSESSSTAEATTSAVDDSFVSDEETITTTEYIPEQEPKLQDIDPFESLTVEFEGTAPYATVLLNDNNKFMSGGSSVCEFKADKTENLKNGDIVTVTASCINQDIYNFTQTEKKYLVEGVAEYISKLEDVPKDVMTKLKKQAEDMLTSEGATWENKNKIVKKEFIGNYFLMAKEGVDIGDSTVNELTLVYKVETSMNGIANEKQKDEWNNYKEYYYAAFSIPNLVIKPDGKCSFKISELTMSENEVNSDYGCMDSLTGDVFFNYKYKGYRDLDSCFKNIVSQYVKNYNYETNVDKKA